MVVTLLHMKRTPKSLMSFSLHFVHCPLNVLECKHQHNPWSWRTMKNLLEKWPVKLVWVREFFFGFSFNVFIFIGIFLSFLAHMIIGVCSAELMESLDAPPQEIMFLVYAETIAIAQAAMSTPIPHTKTRQLSSQVKNFFLLEAWIHLFWFCFLFDLTIGLILKFTKKLHGLLDAM